MATKAVEQFTRVLGRPKAVAQVVSGELPRRWATWARVCSMPRLPIPWMHPALMPMAACRVSRGNGDRDREISVARRGLAASPDAPALVSHLVEALHHLEQAADALEAALAVLAQHNKEGIDHRLGELIAVARPASVEQARTPQGFCSSHSGLSV